VRFEFLLKINSTQLNFIIEQARGPKQNKQKFAQRDSHT